jgi:hypothetical protein
LLLCLYCSIVLSDICLFLLCQTKRGLNNAKKIDGKIGT